MVAELWERHKEAGLAPRPGVHRIIIGMEFLRTHAG
jgi:hypothetical protein